MLPLFLSAYVAFAQDFDYTPVAPRINYTPLAPIPGTGTGTNCAPGTGGTGQPRCLPTSIPDLGTYLRGVYLTGVALAGLFAVFSIVRGGFTLLFTDSILGHMEGKQQLLHAVGGLIIVYSSYILMSAVSPSLSTNLDLSLKFARVKTPPGVFDNLLNLGVDTNTWDRELTEEQANKLIAKSPVRAAEVARQAEQADDEADNLEAEADALDPDDYLTREDYEADVDALYYEAEQRRLDAINLRVKSVSENAIRQSYARGAKAADSTAMDAALTEATQAGGYIEQITKSYDDSITAVTTGATASGLSRAQPSVAADLYFKHVEDLAPGNYGLAEELIRKRPAIDVAEYRVLSEKIKGRMDALNDARVATVHILENLSDNDNQVTRAYINEKIRRIQQITDSRLCVIKDTCKETSGGNLEACANHLPLTSCR